jgi:hypothetical protein
MPVDAHLGRGGNFVMFSGNAVYWQVRYEDGGDTMVCHKYAAREKDPVMGTDRQRELTGIWSDPLTGRPENLLTGLSFCRGGYVRFGRAVPRSTGAYTIHQPKHWAFAAPGLATATPLGSFHIVAYEVDGCDSHRDGVPYPTGAEGTPRHGGAATASHLISNGPTATRPSADELRSTGRRDLNSRQTLGAVTPEGIAASPTAMPSWRVPPSRRRNRLQCRDRRLGLRSRP